MKKDRRQYTREFKLEALRLLETSGKSATQIERDLGIGSGNLYRWKRKLTRWTRCLSGSRATHT